jgi:xanthine dehydrogenase accessory factor
MTVFLQPGPQNASLRLSSLKALSVLFFSAMAKDLYAEIVEIRSKGMRAALATIIVTKGATPRKDSSKMLVYEDGRRLGTIGGGFTEAEVRREALLTLRTGKPKLLSFDLTGVDHEESALVCGGFMQVYVEPVLPDPILFIFGAGFVSRAVAEVARFAGFRIAVVDDRIENANPESFPHADDFYVGPWEAVFDRLPVNQSSYLFIATRGHQLDLLCLRFAVKSQARYTGILGSSRKTQSLFDILEKEGIDPANFKRVFVPVGIDIAAETAEEIAVSLVAELIAIRKSLDIVSIRDTVRRIRNTPASA